MIKKFTTSLLLCGVLCAQTEQDQNIGLNITADTSTVPTTYTVSWWGRPEMHYLMETTPDLTTGWSFLPSYNPSGSGAATGISYQSNAERFFFRVYQFDPSNSGVLTDSEPDGLPDKWELYQFGNLTKNGTGHSDADGVNDADEYAGGTNPNVAESFTATALEATDDTWTPLDAGRIQDPAETRYFKITVTPQLPTIKAAMVRPAFSVLSIGSEDVELSPDNTTLVNTTPGQSELRVRVEPASMMLAFAISGANDNDLVREKASYDSGSTDSSQDGNLTDSDAFVSNFTFDGSDSLTSRGRASDKLGDFPIGVDSVKYAGWQYIDHSFANITENLPVPSQADFFYYSGHGLHASAKMRIGRDPDAGYIELTYAEVKWDEDLDVLVVAGCSILDINNYNGNTLPTYTPIPGWKPGDNWSQTGPRIFLGYNWRAPLDLQDGTYAAAQIANAWIQNREVDGDVGAWQQANDNSFGRNGCAIDVTANIGNRVYGYFHKSGFGPIKFYNWTTVSEASW